MAIHCVAADHCGLIKNKESSWVKLKAFPTNVGRPNNTTRQASEQQPSLPVWSHRPTQDDWQQTRRRRELCVRWAGTCKRRQELRL